MWLTVFGLAALLGGSMIAPKYQQRMERVERMHETRTRVYLEKVGMADEEMPERLHEQQTTSIRWLLGFIALLVIGGGVIGRRYELARARQHEFE